MEKTVSEAIAYRRSVRVYTDQPIDTNKVKQCLVNASLAQVAIFSFGSFTISPISKRGKMAEACLNQNAKTAQHLVVVVTRKDLWKQRANANIEFLNKTYDKPNLSEYERIVKKWQPHITVS